MLTANIKLGYERECCTDLCERHFILSVILALKENLRSYQVWIVDVQYFLTSPRPLPSFTIPIPEMSAQNFNPLTFP